MRKRIPNRKQISLEVDITLLSLLDQEIKKLRPVIRSRNEWIDNQLRQLFAETLNANSSHVQRSGGVAAN